MIRIIIISTFTFAHYIYNGALGALLFLSVFIFLEAVFGNEPIQTPKKQAKT